jgi:hypothetical protein
MGGKNARSVIFVTSEGIFNSVYFYTTVINSYASPVHVTVLFNQVIDIQIDLTATSRLHNGLLRAYHL